MSNSAPPSVALSCASGAAASECVDRLMRAAAEVFMEEGYRGASVDRIAARAGVAKQTLYNHFPSKEQLFTEVIRVAVHTVVVTLENAEGDIRSRLVQFAEAFRSKLLCPVGVAWYRAVLAEVSRVPELGQMVLETGPRVTLSRLTETLAAAMERGELRRDDPAFAAEMLAGMLVHAERNAALLTLEPIPSSDPNRAEKVVDCFLRAFRPE